MIPKKTNLNLEGLTRKTRPLREVTTQELLSEFGDIGKFQPNSMSVGHFRDQVVMKFRRALYYSGIWVTHVQGYRLEKHLSANYFKRNPGCLHRLVPWLKRELTAVYGDYGYTVKNILSTILHHMTEYDLDNHALLASQHDTMQSKKGQVQWNNEQKPLSGLKEFPNGNSALMKSEIPLFIKQQAKIMLGSKTSQDQVANPKEKQNSSLQKCYLAKKGDKISESLKSKLF
ncbi:E3 ubiquitin-protein ligase Topors [Manis javanica]|nr:E3 ubiquitin-protein ligase Topors [Manis javanica]